MSATKHLTSLSASISKETGVPVDHVEKILNKLGLQALEKELTGAVSPERIARLQSGDFKLAARLGRSSVAV